MTGIADTRLLLTLEFQPNQETRDKVKGLFEKELRERLLVPSLVLSEFIKVAGQKLGEDSAKNRLRLLKEKGLQILPIDEETALVAGSLLLSHRNVPIADAIIASYVKCGVADYVVTDDPHFKLLGIKTKWL